MPKNGTIEYEINLVKCGGDKKNLLLHACCAPCASSVLEYILPYFNVDLFYYNPNIMPHSEFLKRLDALNVLLTHFENVNLIVPEQSVREFLSFARGMENVPEGGARCAECFDLRLKATAKFVTDRNAEFLKSTNSAGKSEAGTIYKDEGDECRNNSKLKTDSNCSMQTKKPNDLFNKQGNAVQPAVTKKAVITRYDFFATTLTLSPHKNAELINEIGARAANETNTAYLASDFKKKDGYLRSIQLCKEWNIYRQCYCGCKFD